MNNLHSITINHYQLLLKSVQKPMLMASALIASFRLRSRKLLDYKASSASL